MKRLYCWLYIKKLPPKGKTIPLEAKYRHLPITPFHGGLQKVKGKVDGFTELIRETTLDECSYENVKSRGE
jgi:hypothetical protein